MMMVRCRCINGTQRCESRTRKANQICRYCDGPKGCIDNGPRRLARKKVIRGK